MQASRIIVVLALAASAGACDKIKAATKGADSTKIAQQSGTSSDSATGNTAPPIALPVTVEPARDGDLVLSIITSGQVRSERESHLKSEVTGTIQRVYARPGQTVRRGQTLVDFDPRPFDLTARQRQADVDAAQLRYLDMWLPDSIATGRGPGEERKKAAMTRSGLDGAKLALEQAKLDRERATVVAPF